jgi:hypothetical protein
MGIACLSFISGVNVMNSRPRPIQIPLVTSLFRRPLSLRNGQDRQEYQGQQYSTGNSVLERTVHFDRSSTRARSTRHTIIKHKTAVLAVVRSETRRRVKDWYSTAVLQLLVWSTIVSISIVATLKFRIVWSYLVSSSGTV